MGYIATTTWTATMHCYPPYVVERQKRQGCVSSRATLPAELDALAHLKTWPTAAASGAVTKQPGNTLVCSPMLHLALGGAIGACDGQPVSTLGFISIMDRTCNGATDVPCAEYGAEGFRSRERACPSLRV